jgi:hypothetical protein
MQTILIKIKYTQNGASSTLTCMKRKQESFAFRQGKGKPYKGKYLGRNP